MKLYYAPGACSLSPHIALREAGLPFALERVDLRRRRTADDGDYLRVNPKGYVPALQFDDGSVLTEGPAIVQWVADQAPDAQLAPPAGTLARYRLIEWLNFIGTELHKAFGPLFASDVAPAVREATVARLGRRFDQVAPALSDRPFLLGEQFTVADGYLYVVLRWAQPLQVDLARWPALGAFSARVAARPGVQQALQAEGLA